MYYFDMKELFDSKIVSNLDVKSLNSMDSFSLNHSSRK